MDVNSEYLPNFLENTCDEHQKTRQVPKEELYVWRLCLIKRLQSYTNLGVNLTIEDLDFNDQYLNVPNSDIKCKEELPNNLAKTVFRLKEVNPDRQLIVITLYVKKPTSIEGTILAQGRECSTFGVQEFNSLQALIKSTPNASTDSIYEMNQKLYTIPLNAFHTTTSNQSSVEIDQSTELKSNLRDSRRMSHRFVTRASSSSPCRRQQSTSIPLSPIKEVDIMKIAKDVTSQHIEDAIPEIYHDVKLQLSTFRLQLKNEMKATLSHIEQENEEMKTSISKLQSDNKKLLSQLSESKKQSQKQDQHIQYLKQENQLMKSRIDEQTKLIDHLKLDISQNKPTYANVAKSQAPFQQPINAIPNTNQQNNQMTNNENTEQNPNNHSDIYSKKSTDQYIKYNLPIHNTYDVLSRLQSPNQTKQNTCSNETSTPRPIPVITSAAKHHLSKGKALECHTRVEHDLSETNVINDQNQCCLTYDNTYDFSVNDPLLESNDKEKGHNRPYKNGIVNQNQCSPAYSGGNGSFVNNPLNNLHLTNIDDKTDYLILGDSCISKIDPYKMNTNTYEHVQKVCVPGIKALEIYSWAQIQPIRPKITKLVIHAGVNDSDYGIVSQNNWSQLINVLQKIFPYAQIIMSSIIPTRSNQKTNILISQSNSNLNQACKMFKSVLFVNHTSTFRTTNNAPKKALYTENDQKHPSYQGVILLARNIKYPHIDFRQLYEARAQKQITNGMQLNFQEQVHDNAQATGQFNSPQNLIHETQNVNQPRNMGNKEITGMPARALNKTELFEKMKQFIEEICGNVA